MKVRLTLALVLTLRDDKYDFVVYNDVSRVGLGYVVMIMVRLLLMPLNT